MWTLFVDGDIFVCGRGHLFVDGIDCSWMGLLVRDGDICSWMVTFVRGWGHLFVGGEIC